MSLLGAWESLYQSLDDLDREIEKHLATRSSAIAGLSDFSLFDECFLEGVLSRSWQAWCLFCRTLICESCLGTTDADGGAVMPHPSALSEAYVSAAAIKAKKQPSAIPWGGQNTVLRNEITWGDTDVLVSIIPRMLVPKHGQLVAAFSNGHDTVKLIQTIRNATAHNNPQTMADVLGLSSRFVAYPIAHPIHSLFWVNPVTGGYLFRDALTELGETALLAIS